MKFVVRKLIMLLPHTIFETSLSPHFSSTLYTLKSSVQIFLLPPQIILIKSLPTPLPASRMGPSAAPFQSSLGDSINLPRDNHGHFPRSPPVSWWFYKLDVELAPWINGELSLWRYIFRKALGKSSMYILKKVNKTGQINGICIAHIHVYVSACWFYNRKLYWKYINIYFFLFQVCTTSIFICWMLVRKLGTKKVWGYMAQSLYTNL